MQLAQAIIDSRVDNNGQLCNNVERIYVQESVADEFIDKLTQKMVAMTVGDPLKDEEIGIGSLINQAALDKVNQKSEIVQKEIFGPVLLALRFKTLDEAIEMANDSELGLTSSIYTNNLNNAYRTLIELEFGETYINRFNFEAMNGYHFG